MGRFQKVLVTLTAALLVALVACGGGGADLQSVKPGGGPSAPDSATGGSPGIPSPAEALTHAATPRVGSAAALVRQGVDFEPSLVQRVSSTGFNACFSPNWTSNASAFDTLAYAIYRFNLPGYSGDQTLRIIWAAPPAEYGDLWIGFSKWDPGRWDWYPGPAGGIVDLSSTGFAQYVRNSTANDLLVAVVVMHG